MIVDSCIHENGEPVSIAYLKEMGIDVGRQVPIVVASHWHDDHVRGLARAFKECENATIVFASALTREEFQTLIEAYGDDRMLPGSSGVREIKGVIDCLRSRSPKGAPAPLCLSGADKRIYCRQLAGAISAVEVWSLSPPDSAAMLALRDIGSWLLPSKKPKRRVEAQRPNHLATVLWVEMGGRRMLLGADLEQSQQPDLGWKAILSSKTRPQGRAEVFKVPHHGSKNAHSPEVWQDMLDKPISTLTAFNRSCLPRPTEIRVISSLSREAYLTSPPNPTHWAPPDPAVARTLRESKISIENETGGLGHVRVRWQHGSTPATEIFGAARRLDS